VNDLRERVAANLARFAVRPVDTGAERRAAAVAVCVVGDRVLLIKRASRGRSAGQWALPGGRIDAGETPVEAAVRELAEEVAVVAGPTDVLGTLDDFVSATGFIITPVVVFPTGPVRPRRNPDEVHSIHPVPLRALLDPAVPRWRPQSGGRPLLQLPLRRYLVVHAPTGAILWQFREVALLGNPMRVAGTAEPAFVRDGSSSRRQRDADGGT
jgi:8-oxo-dGTP pyrophosphatase MutT (NUDIX family)